MDFNHCIMNVYLLPNIMMVHIIMLFTNICAVKDCEDNRFAKKLIMIFS
jgi:hypothetical protein